MTARVLLADDHPMIRSAVTMLLEGTDFTVAAHAVSGESALAAIRDSSPDIVILDLAMRGGSGLEVLRQIRSEKDERAVVILTAAIDDRSLAEALALGADGIVLKNSDPAYLLDCLESVRQGGRWLDPELGERIAALDARDKQADLSPREGEIVALVAQGMRNREIALELGITEGTVKVYLHAIFEKLGVSNRTELAIRAGLSSGRIGT